MLQHVGAWEFTASLVFAATRSRQHFQAQGNIPAAPFAHSCSVPASFIGSSSALIVLIVTLLTAPEGRCWNAQNHSAFINKVLWVWIQLGWEGKSMTHLPQGGGEGEVGRKTQN